MYDPAHGPACGACLTAGVSLGYAARGVWACGAVGAQRAPHVRGGALRAGRVDGSCGLLARRGPRRKACGERGGRRLGNIANENCLTAGSSAPRRGRQLLYFQYMSYCSRRRKTTVGRNVLRHFVSRQFYKSLCTTDQTCFHPYTSFSVLPAVYAMMETRRRLQTEHQARRRRGGLCRGGGSSDRPPAPARPLDISDPPVAVSARCRAPGGAQR